MFFRRPLPPIPPQVPFYKKPAVVSIILTVVIVFVLGPVGVIYTGMSEELKKKVDNSTLQLMIQKDREAIKRTEEGAVKRDKAVEENRNAIIENQKVLIMIQQRPSVALTGPRATIKPKEPPQRAKLVLTPEQFERYLKMGPDVQVKYKTYLESRGYDISGLP